MIYTVRINKKYNYIKVYKILKRIGGNENKLSKALANWIDKLASKKEQTGSL
ncbi:MAG: hypothetical protein QW091_00295 [Candidatus Micrarchaeaceae archaeon]